MIRCLRRSRRIRHGSAQDSWRGWSAPGRWSRSSAPFFRWRTRARGSSIIWRRPASCRRCSAASMRARRRRAPCTWLPAIALATAAFPPNSAMVVFIFLISVSHALLLAAFLRLRQREPGSGAKLPRAGRRPGRRRGAALVALGHGVVLSARGTCLADRHRGDRRADRAVPVAQTRTRAGDMNNRGWWGE